MTRALITGVTGQDGAYLAKHLVDAGYEVYGGDCQFTAEGLARLQAVGVEAAVRLLPLDLRDAGNVNRHIEQIQPDEVYNLAAQSAVVASFSDPLLTTDVNAAGALRVLEALRRHRPDARVFQASTAQLFGDNATAPQDESTPFAPCNPYAVAKLFAHWMTATYRAAHGMFACCGILFNHESPLRGIEFVTRKITDGAARIKLGAPQRVTLGNLDARRDWGYAADYVEAMRRILQQAEPDDYVIATGTARTVREFVEAAFRAVEIPIVWRGHGPDEQGIDPDTGQVIVDVSPAFFRPVESAVLVGNAAKARRQLGWEPHTRFETLVATMVAADLERVAAEARR